MKWMKSFFDIKFLKFICVGVINTLVGTGVMFLAYNIWGLGYWISSAANYVVGSIVSYILNKHLNHTSLPKICQYVFIFIQLICAINEKCKDYSMKINSFSDLYIVIIAVWNYNKSRKRTQ